MDTLTHNGATLSGTAVVNGQAPARNGTFTTKDLKWGNTFLNQQCCLKLRDQSQSHERDNRRPVFDSHGVD